MKSFINKIDSVIVGAPACATDLFCSLILIKSMHGKTNTIGHCYACTSVILAALLSENESLQGLFQACWLLMNIQYVRAPLTLSLHVIYMYMYENVSYLSVIF